jgi:4-hydroxybutyryl-CoA dehydratase/vinylacetyl-CoA-Delta-isomerase
MATAEKYVGSMQDGRQVWMDGHRVADVTEDVLLAKSVDWVRSSYDRYDGRANPAFTLPVTQNELREQFEELLRADRTLTSTAASVALLAHYDIASYGERARALVDDARDQDIRFAVASADTAKRVRVVDRRPDGIVVSGGKQSVIGAAVVHELLVVPGGAVATPEEAVAFTVPVNAPGLRIVVSTTAPRAVDDRHYPISRHNSISEALVIMNDVFIPYEHVVLDGEVELSAALPTALNEVDLAVAVAAQADRAELLLGLAQSIAEMNGTVRVAHIQDKLGAIAVYAKMCRAGWKAALAEATVRADGRVRPDESYLYATKSYGTRTYSDMTYFLHDVAGGAVITAPTIADLDNPEIGDFCRKYMRTMESVSGEERIRIFHAIRDLTADAFGGWDKVTSQAVGGSMNRQRIAALELSDLTAAKDRARAEAGITN